MVPGCNVPKWDYNFRVRVIALSALKAFWTRRPEHRDAEQPVLAWYRDVLHADWATTAAVKAQFRMASMRNADISFFAGDLLFLALGAVLTCGGSAWLLNRTDA